MTIDITSIFIGMGIMLFLVLIYFVVYNLFFNKKKKRQKTSMTGLKAYVRNAHNDLVSINDKLELIKKDTFDAADNMIKLYEVFNDVDDKTKGEKTK